MTINHVFGKPLTRFVLEINDHIAVINMAHQPINVIDEAFEEELVQVCRYINQEDDAWVTVLISACKTFTAGVDIHLFKRSIEERTVSDTQEKYYNSALALYELRTPVICAVHGYCLGGGFCYMAGADLAIAAEGTKLGLPEVNICVTGGSGHLARLLPAHIMREMAYTGRFVPVEELMQYGVVNCIVPQERLREEAMAMARELTAKGPYILEYFKACMDRQEDLQMKRKNDLEIIHTRYMAQHPDFAEAFQAFLEKRPPVFQGREK